MKQQPPQCEKSEFFCFFVIQVLRNVVLFLVLSPYDNEQSDFIHRVGEEENSGGNITLQVYHAKGDRTGSNYLNISC